MFKFFYETFERPFIHFPADFQGNSSSDLKEKA